MNALVPMALLQQATARVATGGLLHAPDTAEPAPTVWRDLWQSRHGAICIEVVDGVCYVNGDRVEPPPAAGHDDNAWHGR
jgi:hypothetical protein